MIYTDEYISSKLGEIGRTGLAAAPIEGEWQLPPYQQIILNDHRYAIIIKDIVFNVIVERSCGVVLFDLNDLNMPLINSTLEKFCKCAIKWRELSGLNEDISDDERDRIVVRLGDVLSEIDTAAFQDENQLWPVAIEEFGYGI